MNIPLGHSLKLLNYIKDLSFDEPQEILHN
jgi:hypothetical protein